MSRTAVAAVVLMILVILMSHVKSHSEAPASLISPAPSSAASQEGIFRCGAIYLKLNHDVIYAIISTDLIYPVLKCDVAVWDTTMGYTDGLGNVTFRVPVHILDNTDSYNAWIRLSATVDNRTTWEHVGDDFKMHWTSEQEDTFYYWDFAADQIDSTSGTNRYYINLTVNVTVHRWLREDREWYDFDWSNTVYVQSRQHTPWQQTVEITIPADSSTYVIGSHNQNVIGFVEAGDNPPPGYGRAHMMIVTNEMAPNQESSFTTGANGGFWEPLYIPEPTAEGEVSIHVYDDPRSDEYIASLNGDEITVFAERSSGWTTFGLYAVPGHRVVSGDSTEYMVALPSYEGYEGPVSLDVMGVPADVTYSFEANPVSLRPDTTVGVMLTLRAGGLTPVGFHEITITASDDTLTRDFVCPLLVEDLIPPDPVFDLEVMAADDSSATLWWTAPGASADSGWAYLYEVRYSTIPPGPDGEAWWAAADTIARTPMAGPPGWRDTCTVGGLTLPENVYYFALKTANGGYVWSDISNIAEMPGAGVERPEGPGSPMEFALLPNSPDPFTNETEIRYAVPRQCRVSLVIYDIRGRRVANLVDSEQRAGYKSVTWNAATVSPGIYFCRFRAADFHRVEKMIVLR